MVFGNLGEDSGTGVLFSRNPLSGDPEPYGEWLPRGQGEDVVSGTHDPLPLEALERLAAGRPRAPARGRRSCSSASTATSRTSSSRSSAASSSCCRRVRPSARRWPPCAPPSTSRTRARSTAPRPSAGSAPSSWRRVLAPRLSTAVSDGAEVLARGVAACPGVAGGRAVADSDAAAASAEGDVVLVRPTTSPEDVSGMIAAARRGHRARRLDLARGGRHPRPRPAQRGRRRRGRDRRAGRSRADRRRLRRRRLRRHPPDRGRRPRRGAGPRRADRVGARAEPGRRSSTRPPARSTSTPRARRSRRARPIPRR